MSRALRIVLIDVAASLAVVLFANRGVAADDRDAIAVVVGIHSKIETVGIDDLREIFLKRRRFWIDGSRLTPINSPADNPLRERFSRRVLGQSPQQMVSYWDRMFFNGINPPITLKSSAAVCAYLASDPTAIAYLPIAALGPGCPARTLLVLDNPESGRATSVP